MGIIISSDELQVGIYSLSWAWGTGTRWFVPTCTHLLGGFAIPMFLYCFDDGDHNLTTMMIRTPMNLYVLDDDRTLMNLQVLEHDLAHVSVTSIY